MVKENFTSDALLKEIVTSAAEDRTRLQASTVYPAFPVQSVNEPLVSDGIVAHVKPVGTLCC